MLEILRKKFETYDKTCPINNLKDGCVTFIRDKKYIHYLKKNKDVWVIAPKELKNEFGLYQEAYSPDIKGIFIDYPEYYFCLYHNMLYGDRPKIEPKIGKGCKIHETVVMDVDGLKIINGPNGEKVQFIHSGWVEIGDNVEIGPYTVIHRGTMAETKISNNCKIGAKNNIGHNCFIGENTVFAVGAILNGGVLIGKNCWISSGVMIKHYTKITNDVVLGMGTMVLKDIMESGIYVGIPAKFLKPIEKGWNF